MGVTESLEWRFIMFVSLDYNMTKRNVTDISNIYIGASMSSREQCCWKTVA